MIRGGFRRFICRWSGRQLLHFYELDIKFYKMIFSVTLYLILVSAVSDGFFLGSYRKQPDCAHRAPHAASWHQSQTTASGSVPTTIQNKNSNSNINNNNNPNSGVNPGQPSYGTYKEYGSYHQPSQTVQPQQNIQVQQPQQLQQLQSSLKHQPQQQQQPQHQSQVQQQQSQLYTTQPQTVPTGTKYDPAAYQVYNQQQFSYDGGYGSYPQNVQLIPCLCPVNKEIIEQQQLQQQQNQPQPLYSPPSYTAESDVSSQTNSKKNS